MDKEAAIYKRTARGFEPANDLAQEFWSGCKLDDLVALKGSRPRNLIFLKLWWAMLQDIAANCNPPMTAKQLNFFAKVGTGTGTWVKVKAAKGPQKGQPVPVFEPGSISFAAMDQVEFKRFTREAAAFLCESFLPGVAPEHFIRDLEELAI
jgi:hypothetical protein